MAGSLRVFVSGALALVFAGFAAAQETPPAASPTAPSAGEVLRVPSLEDFLAEPSTIDVALAPGGRYIATVRVQAGVSYLTMLDLKDPDAKLTATKLGDVRVYGLKWVNDDRLVYSAGATNVKFAVKRGALQLIGVPQLYAINRDLTGNMQFFDGEKKITGNNIVTTSDISLIPGDAENFIVPLRIGGDLDLIRVSSRDGKWTTLAQGEDYTMAWFVDRDGQPAIRFDTNRRGTELRVMTPEPRGGGQVRWKLANKLRINQETSKAEDFDPMAPGPTANLYYVLGRPSGADRIGIHLYDIETQRYTQEVFTHPRVDIETALVDPATGSYVGAAYWNDRLEMTFTDKKMQAHFNGLNEFFGRERSIAFIDRSSDQQVWVLATYGPRDPGSFHVYDMAAAKSRMIGISNPRLREDQLGKTQPVSYAARDGLSISGYLTMPPRLKEGEKPPLIVYPHGGPEVRDAETYDVTVQFLATRGYAVFQPNFRGSSGYGKAFAESGRRQFGKAMQTDIVDGVNHLLAQGLVDGARICIMGESYGGYAALMGLVQFPDLYRCGVSSSGPTDLYRQIRWERDEEGSDSEAYKYWVAQVGDPSRDRAEMEAISPIKNIPAIKAPVMLMHGELDDTVPFEQSELMHQALRKAGKASTIVQFEGAGHGFGGSDLEAFLTQLEKFFAKHLAPPSAPPAGQ
jgi:dipeptidyl aminopeptidase/acylaminoacyl peptidase